MTLSDERQPDLETEPAPWASKDGKSALARMSAAPCTIRDVARLAGVSIATVSRVTSGSVRVSGKTKTKVLEAASALKYFPNAQAAELARAKEGRPRRHGNHVPSMAGAKFKMIFHSGADEHREPLQRG
jgi:transcriptional regulator with XRE-family HTH domain